MKTNIKEKKPVITTHEGGPATATPNAAVALRRAVMACLLWEDEFYESGVTIAERIKMLVPQVPPEAVANFAIKAREDMKLRHAPLLLVAAMATPTHTTDHHLLVAATLERVIQRADELAEFIAIYAKVWGYEPSAVRKHLSAQTKRGIARAFKKFNEYALAKYNRDGSIKLRDSLFLSHAKPGDALPRAYTRAERKAERAGEVKPFPLTPGERRFKALAEGTLATPDTWEVELSAGADKKETFERLMVEDKLGALALLRNLRGMLEAKVDQDLIQVALEKMDATRVLPHRFIAAARAAPSLEHILEPAMLLSAAALPKLAGRTILLIDVSGSMEWKMSKRSDLSRMDAATGLAIIARELCEKIAIATFSNKMVEVPPRRGFALRDAIVNSQEHGGTYLGQAVTTLNGGTEYDRIIVVTDEQTHDAVPRPKGKGYMINVASNEYGIGYGDWNKIDGFSEAVIRYIAEAEADAGQ